MKQKTIMFINANTLWRVAVCYSLNENGYNCVGVNPKEATSIYKAFIPGLVVFMETDMHNKDYVTYSKEILSHNPEAKIIVLAMHIFPEAIIWALELGIQDIIERVGIDPADPNNMLYNRLRNASLYTRKYDLNIVKNKLSAFDPFEGLSQLKIDDILLSSQI